MKGIIRFSTSNAFAIWLMTLIVTAAGIYAGLTMKQETIPNIDIPILTVYTVYPGEAPQEVAERITGPLERRIKPLPGVSGISSTSMESVSSIVIEYGYDKNLKEAEAELRETLDDFVPPEGAQKTVISKLSINDFPVISLSVAGQGDAMDEVSRIVEQELSPALEAIDGVAAVSIAGQQIRELLITFDRARMAELGLSEETVKTVVQANALQIPLGLFEFGDEEKSVIVDGNVRTLEQLSRLPIPILPDLTGGRTGQGAGGGMPTGTPSGMTGMQSGMPGGTPKKWTMPDGTVMGGHGSALAGALAMPGMQDAGLAAGLPTVTLSDIARLELTVRAESISRTNGKASIGLQVSKAAEANTVQVVHAVRQLSDQFAATYPDMDVDVMLDQGKPIEDSVATMLEKALFGSLFAIIIILLFLRNFRTTVIAVVSIPLSLLIAVLLLQLLGMTLNIMTLGAMTVAIGRVVDDSIVVIENNYRRMQLPGEPLRGSSLILDATYEMFIPILSSTLVTIAVFLPLGLVKGPVGELFMPFALTMVFALLASLLVAITVVPMMTHLFFRRGARIWDKSSGEKAGSERSGALGEAYRRMLSWSLRHKAVTFTGAIALLAASLLLFPVVGVSFIPQEEEKMALVTYSPGPGTPSEEVERHALEAEQAILAREGVASLQYSIGRGGNPLAPGSDKSALFYVQYDPDFAEFSGEKDKLVSLLQTIDERGTWGQMDMGAGAVGGSRMTLYVYGEDSEQIQPIVERIQEDMRAIGSFDKIDSSLASAYGQYTLSADQEKLSRLGLTTGQLAMALMPARERPVLTEVTDDGKLYNVYVAAEPKTYASITDIGRETITSKFGPIAIGDVVTIEEGESADTITHRNGKLYAQVTADVVDKNVGKASNELMAKVNAYELPAAVNIDFGGVTEQITKTFRQLGIAMAAAVAIVYLLLVITFGGGLTPFAILFSLPFTVIGALAGLALAGETLSAPAMMGLLMLIGIVVTNAIVLIDRVLHMEKRGMGTREALLEAAGTRLRPILMTALATIGALLPLAFGAGGSGGGLITRGLGVAVIGGLTSSTLLTLIIVPIVYEAVAKFRRVRTNEEAAE